MNNRISKLIDTVIFVGTGCLALSGLLFIGSETKHSLLQTPVEQSRSDFQFSDSRHRVAQLLDALSGPDGFSIVEPGMVSPMGAPVFLAHRGPGHGSDIVVVDHSAASHHDLLSFTDSAGKALLLLRASNGIFALQDSGASLAEIRVQLEGRDVEIIDLTGYRSKAASQ